MIGPRLRQDRLPGRAGFMLAVIGPLIAVALVTALAALVYTDATMKEIVLIFGINAIMVVGFQAFVGNTGLVSFGHIAFMAVGAYATGITSIPIRDKEIFLPDLPGFLASMELDALPSLLVGGAAAALLALVSGVALMRLSGAAASIATLGLLVIVVNVLSQATSITHGPQSLYGVPSYTDFGSVFILLAVAVLLSAAFKWSSAGLRARANRDDPMAAEASGVGPLRARLAPFVLSAFLTGVGGGLYAQLLTGFSPGSFTIPLVVVVLTMAIVGGINSITGALIGAATITVLNELLRRVEDGVSIVGTEIDAPTGISGAVLGIMLIVMLRSRPAGLFSDYEFQFERGAGSAAGPAAAPPTSVAGDG